MMDKIYTKAWDVLGFLTLLFLVSFLWKQLEVTQLKKEQLMLNSELLTLQINLEKKKASRDE